MKARKLISVLKVLLLAALGVVVAFPFFWMISCALREPGELLTMKLLPDNPTIDNFRRVLFETDIPRYFLNSLMISLTATLMCIVIALPAGYSFARHTYRGKTVVVMLILMCNMIPQTATLVPLYQGLNSLRLLDNKIALAFTHLLCMLPFSIMMTRGFIRTLPKTLEEAALIDGCSRIGVMTRVLLPIAAPGIFATAMYAFMISWEEFTYSMTFTNSQSARPVSVGLQMFSTEYKVDWGAILASSVLMTIPILTLFFLVQDTFIASATGGALKE